MYAQHRLAPGAVVGHLGAHVLHICNHPARQLQQVVARRRELQAARVPLKQLGLELVLQQREPPAGGRHGDVAGLGRAGEVAQLGRLHEQGQ